MTFNSVEEIYQSIDESRARLQRSVEALTDGELSFHSSPDRWSIAEILEHLSIVERQLARLCHVMVAKAEASQNEPRAEVNFAPVSIEQLLEPLKNRKFEAPKNARPKGDVSAEEALARLAESRAALHALRTRIEQINGRSVMYPHPVAGEMDLYQWLLFVGAHDDRHRAQIEAMVSSFPF
jgi:uncharacterized damage-inducible protein DinB